jgi:uncharacterized membrane protein (DUF485 family)
LTRATGPRRRHSTGAGRATYHAPGIPAGDFGRDQPAVAPTLWGTGPTPEPEHEVPPPSRRVDYAAIHCSREFSELRTRLRRFVFPMTFAFLGWYLIFVLLAAYAHDFMGRRVAGLVTVGMLLGLGQFVTTLAITFIYNRYAKRNLDPQVRLVRALAGEGPA